MKPAHRTLATFAMAMVAGLAFTACGEADDSGTPGDDALVDQVDEGAADSAVKRPEGKFVRKGAAAAGQLVSVTLNSDRTYHREVLVVCITAPCNPVVESGSYRYSRAGSTRYIRFSDEGGSFVDRYAYTFMGDTLKLRGDGTRQFVTFTRAADACDYDDAGRRYVAESPSQCTLVRFACDTAAGETPFFDDCGCGCELPAAPAVPATCGGPSETRPRGGCPAGYDCNCPNGAACIVAGTCSPSSGPSCNYNDAGHRYVARSPSQCAAIRFTCDAAAGESAFFDDCGCGCLVPAGSGPTLPASCGGVGERRPRGGCPEGYSCNCPNGAACFVAGTCTADSADR